MHWIHSFCSYQPSGFHLPGYQWQLPCYLYLGFQLRYIFIFRSRGTKSFIFREFFLKMLFHFFLCEVIDAVRFLSRWMWEKLVQDFLWISMSSLNLPHHMFAKMSAYYLDNQNTAFPSGLRFEFENLSLLWGVSSLFSPNQYFFEDGEAPLHSASYFLEPCNQ